MTESSQAALPENHSEGEVSRPGPGVAAATLALIGVSWLLLYPRIWSPGLETTFKDARHHLASAVRLASVGRLELLELRFDPVQVASEPLSSFPPLTSWALAALIAGGASVEQAPTLLALAAWPVLLGSIAVLTYRLCHDSVLTLLAVGIAAITWPYLSVFTELSSEILFLPSLVLATATFTGLAEKEHGTALPLAIGSLLTACVMLSRYTGIFFYGALLVWWSWHRSRQGRWRRLIPELAILAIPGFAFFAWSARNVALTGHPFAPTLMSETLEVGYRHVAETFLTQGTWLVLPAVRPGPLWRTYGVLGAGLVLAIVGVGAFLLWRSWRRGRLRLPSSPLLPFLLFYVGFLALAPSFMRMQGMIERYMAVVLALAQPYLVARLAGAPRTWTRAFLIGFLVIQLGLALSFTAARNGLGFWIEREPLRATDLAGQPDEQLGHLLAGTPAWWVHRPPRLHDLERHLPEVYQVVNRLHPETPIVSNPPELFSMRPLLPLSLAVEVWVERGGCHLSFPVAVVVVDWDRWTRGGETARGTASADRLRSLLDTRCPSAQRLESRRATVYLLTDRARAQPVAESDSDPREVSP